MFRFFLGLIFVSSLASAADCPELLNFRTKTLQGEAVDFCEYAGKPLLVVNTASKCGFTPQFEKLEAMYRQYKSQGLVVVGFPSNDFFQELDSSKDIAEFCKLTYLVEFPMMQASSVRGSKANPFFRRLSEASGTTPKWNFYKYLVSPDGKTVQAFGSITKPDDPEIMNLIQSWLVKPGSEAGK